MKDQAGRVFLVTGSNTGIGRVTAEELARRGARVYLACRSLDKTQPVLDAIQAEGGDARFLELDLGSLASVRACAKAFLAENVPLHGLINNAGVAKTSGLTKDGFEPTFQVNHLGHFLLTNLLLAKLEASAPARIVNVSSTGHYRAPGIDWDAVKKPTATVTGLREYQISKLANVLFTKELARRLAGTGVTSYSLHPGVVASDVWRGVPWGLRSLIKLFMITNEEGAQTSLYCATSPEVEGKSGAYFDKSRERTPSKLAHDEALARRLWDESAAWVGLGATSAREEALSA
jgi:NAD(P)-dependent dehydrogenase (short-subunit alcohol dehydrogenase family)